MNDMNTPIPQSDAGASALADLFKAPARETAATLAIRADGFRAAIARGGPREDYQRWLASLEALQAAHDILGPTRAGKPLTFSIAGESPCP